MRPLRLVTIVGARPQFIKASALSRVIRSSGQAEELLVHTGQHYDDSLSGRFFEELDLPEPGYNLGIGSATHGAQTGRMLESIEGILQSEAPDWVLVYGDTNSTLAGALAAAKLHIPVAHVEAGLRSFNRRMPEEVNRVLTDHLSDLLLTPTTTADQNLAREGIDPSRVVRTGDVMFDVARHLLEKAEKDSDVLERTGLGGKPFVLATIHRAENVGERERLERILQALEIVSREVAVILPLHPGTRDAMNRAGLELRVRNGPGVVEPLGYLDMLVLERRARLVATDSGGVQKEAYFAGTPCVTLREETEWTELVNLGWNSLASPADTEGAGPEWLASRILEGLDALPGPRGDPYGSGDAAERILAALLSRR